MTSTGGQNGSARVIGTLALAGVAVSLQQTLVIPLLPQLPRLLDTSAANASWLVTATLLTGAAATPVISRLADMYGKSRLMSATLWIMLAGSVVGSLASSVGIAILARGMLGVGVALVPVGIAAMSDELPPQKVSFGIALMSATLAIGAGAGLPLSGLIAQHLDWRAIFWISGAVCAIMLVLVPRVMRHPTGTRQGRFDFAGAVVLSSGLVFLMLTLSKGGQWGWTSINTLMTLAVGTGLLVLWVPMQVRHDNPIVDLRVAARPAVLLVNTTAALLGFAMYANMLVTTQLLQLPAGSSFGLGLSTTEAGLWMAPSALAFGALAPGSAYFIERFGGVTALITGATLMALAYVARVFLSDTLPHIVTGSLMVSLGTAMTYAAMPTLILRETPRAQHAAASGINALMRSIGTSTSSAATAALIAGTAVAAGSADSPSFDSLITMFWVSAAVSALAAVVALPLRPDAAPASTR